MNYSDNCRIASAMSFVFSSASFACSSDFPVFSATSLMSSSEIPWASSVASPVTW